jgi:hypothetical protein
MIGRQQRLNFRHPVELGSPGGALDTGIDTNLADGMNPVGSRVRSRNSYHVVTALTLLEERAHLEGQNLLRGRTSRTRSTIQIPSSNAEVAAHALELSIVLR